MEANFPDDLEIQAQIQRGLRDGDFAALELLWDRFGQELLAYLTGVLASRQDAEDVLQDVFRLIAKKRKLVGKAQNFRGYLYRLAKNKAVNEMRTLKRRRARNQNYSDQWLVEKEGEEALSEVRSLEEAMAKLPEKQRTVIVLKFYQEMTFVQIGRALKISENSAASRYRYGMDKLRNLVKK